MKSTRNRISAAAELSAGVKDCEHNLNSRLVFRGVHVDGDSAAIVDDANAAVGENRDVNE